MIVNTALFDPNQFFHTIHTRQNAAAGVPKDYGVPQNSEPGDNAGGTTPWPPRSLFF
jgi:hypothetical protein